MNNRILLIRTGGTIDSKPYENPKHPPENVETLKGEQSAVLGCLKMLLNGSKVDAYNWGEWHEDRFVKDSKDFNNEDICALANTIKYNDHNYVIITHGTDAMAKNAALLQEKLGNTDKTVVFVGAMVPLSMQEIHKSDGKHNLRYALANIATQKSGVYVLGRDAHTKRLEFFNPQQVEKDREKSLNDLNFTLGFKR